jgi:mono/diheme cytochrome c family protein
MNITNKGEAAARQSRRLSLAVAIGAALWIPLAAAFAQAPQFTPRDEAPENFPASAGRDETFYSCTACHNFKLVAAQGLSRRQWDESIALMVQKHGMPVLDDKDKTIVLDYLETAFPPRAPSSGGWQNPFLKQ